MYRGGMVLLLGACGIGCGYLKEYAPINVGSVELRIPNQQRIVSQSTQQAVARAAAELKLSQYAGRTARVEVNGVFPHTASDLLDYLASTVESEAASAGVKVLARPLPVIVRSEGAAPGVLYSPPPPPAERSPDLRLVASVDWGGIDLKDERALKPWPLAGQLGLGFLGVAGPLIGIAAAEGDGDAVGPAVAIMGVSVVGATVWALLHSSTAHTFTMLGRVRVTLRAIPVADGVAAATGVGEAENSIVIDPESSSGFALTVSVPKDD